MNNSIKVPKIKINAEHQRQIWLNFSSGILVVIILFYLGFSYFGYDAQSYSTDPVAYFRYLTFFSHIAFFVSLIFLVQLLRRSMKNDIESKIWDQLRMSSLSAWQMTWTRLFSAPLLAWISILISSLIASYSIFQDNLINHETADSFLGLWLTYVISSLALASFALINLLQFNRPQNEWQSSTLQIILLALICYFYPTFLFSTGIGFHLIANTENPLSFSPVNLIFPNDYFLNNNTLILIVMLYLMVGAWRSMAFKLHLKSSNLYWLIASLALPIVMWLAYMSTTLRNFNILLFITIFYGILIFISVSTQNSKWSVLKRGFHELKLTHFKKCIEILPIWCFILPIYILILLALCISNFDLLFYVLINLIVIFTYIALVLFATQFSKRYNPITVAMLCFLLLRVLTSLIFLAL